MKKVTLILTILILSSILAEAIRHSNQGSIRVEEVVAVFAVCEVLFSVGIAILLVSMGTKINLKAIKEFQFEKFRAEKSPGIVLGFTLNRFAAIFPFAYIIWKGWGTIPWITIVACFLEIGLCFWIGHIFSERLGIRKTKKRVIIRPATHEDLPGIIAVDQVAWGGIFPGTREMFASRIDTFPEGGVIVAIVDGNIVAFTSTQILDKSIISPMTTWDEISDNGTLKTTHNPSGEWVYGVGLAATPEAASHNAVTPLLLSVGRMTIKMHKRGIVLVARMPGYARYHQKHPECDPSTYALLQRHRRPFDAELKMYARHGVKVIEPPVIIKDYMGEDSDTESEGYNVLVQWTNVFYSLPFPKIWAKVFSV